MTQIPISQDQIGELNARATEALVDEYESLGRQLERRGVDIEAIKDRIGLAGGVHSPILAVRAACKSDLPRINTD